MPYPKNFVVRLLISIAGMYAIWMAVQFVVDVLIHHETFTIGVFDIVVPLAMGVAEAIAWKPKE